MNNTAKGFTLVFDKIAEFLPGDNYIDDKSRPVISSGGRSTPFYFLCPVCKKNSGLIDASHLRSLNPGDLPESGFPLDYLYKVQKCKNCTSTFYIGVGPVERSRGWEDMEISAIIKVRTGSS